MSLDGKRIIVTGAATGIGRATVLAVAEQGARVAAFDVNDIEGSAATRRIQIQHTPDQAHTAWRADQFRGTGLHRPRLLPQCPP